MKKYNNSQIKYKKFKRLRGVHLFFSLLDDYGNKINYYCFKSRKEQNDYLKKMKNILLKK